MKRIIMAAMVLSVVTGVVFGVEKQEKPFSLYAQFGYGIPAGGYYLGSSRKYENNATPIESKDQYLNFGQGLKIEAGAIYEFMPGVSGQVDFQFSGHVPRTVVRTEYTVGTANYSDEITYKNALFGFALQVVPRFTVFDLLDVYIGAGPGLYFASSKCEVIEDAVPAPFGNARINETIEERYFPALAFVGTLGVEYPLIPEVILIGDVRFEQMSFTLDERKTTDNINNSVNVQEYKSNSVNLPHPDIIPGSNVQIRVGARFPLF